MKRFVTFLIALLLLPAACLLAGDAPAPAKKIKIILVGDSTVTDKAGWGAGFKQYLTDQAECINTSAGGRSSKSFLAEGRWQKALDLKGDYYLIQFGHNDEPGKGPDRETDPNTTYTQNMTRYVDEARAIGAKPILVTSLVRRAWDKSGNGKINSSLVPYVEAVKKIAAEKNVPLVDLHALSQALCEKLGQAECDKLSPVNASNRVDNTHLNAKGSVVFAGLVVKALTQAIPELAPCFHDQPVAASAKVFNVRTYGAKGDGQTLDTAAIQSALDACAAAGGGRVEVPAGTYLIKPIVLKSNGLTFQLDAGATLQATDNFSDFDSPEKPGAVVPLISANGLTDLTITGQGTIDGAGAKWWPDVRVAKQAGKPETRHRPRLVNLSKCLNTLVENITLQNSPSFHLVPSDCEDMTIDGVTIRAPFDSPNTDAIDPSTCRHLHILRCVLDVGDDNVAIKSGHVDAAHPNAACEDILVENCTFLHGHGMSIGSETTGGVKGLTVRNCTFTSTVSGIRIKTDRTRGGTVADCTYTDLTMTDVNIPVSITCYYPKVPPEDTTEPVTDRTPHFQNITISNLTATGAQTAGLLIGLPESPINGLTLQNINIAADKGFEIRNTRKLRFTNANIATTTGQAYTIRNSEMLGFGNPSK